MNKSNLLTGIIYTMAGLIFLAISFFNTSLQYLFAAFAGAGIFTGIPLLYKYFYWTQPQNQSRYFGKMEEDNIELHDERKEYLRCKTARYVYALNLVSISFSVIIFGTLEKLGIIRNSSALILYLVLFFFFELIVFNLIYNILNKKY